jgi:hypothetical protein
VQQSSWQHLCHFEKVKEEPFRAPESAAITPRQGDNIGHAVLPNELPIEPDPLTLQIPISPDNSAGISEAQAIAPQGASQVIELAPAPSIAAEGVVGRQSGCDRQPTQRFVESQQQLAEGIVSYFTAHEAIDPKMYQEDLLLKEFEMDPISFKATADPDTLYLHEAMTAPDAAQFQEAMKHEVSEHTKKGNWEVVLKSAVPSH